jgi:hypothetical protein
MNQRIEKVWTASCLEDRGRMNQAVDVLWLFVELFRNFLGLLVAVILNVGYGLVQVLPTFSGTFRSHL